MPITDLESTMTSNGTRPGKEYPFPSCREGGGCMPHHIDGIVGEQLTEEQKAPPYSRQWREQPLYAYLALTNDHHQVTQMPAMGKLQGVAMVQTLIVEPP